MDDALKIMFMNVQIGMCPYAGSRCGDGGPLRKNFTRSNGAAKALHDPVEGGEKNCIMCRHLISGPAWLKPLWLFGTYLMERFTRSADRLDDLDSRRNDLTERRNNASTEQERILLQRQEQALDVQRDGIAAAQEITAKSIHRVKMLVEMAEVIRKGGETNGAQTVGSDLIAIDFGVTEFMEATEFERSAIITASSRVYSIMFDSEAEAQRDAFLDKLMLMNRTTPISMAPLTREQKRFAQDSLARMLMERVERAETQALLDGSITLEDVGLSIDVEMLVRKTVGATMTLGISHNN